MPREKECRSVGRRICDIGHKGVSEPLKESTTHWVAGSVTGVLWGSTAGAAMIHPQIQVYITILSAAVMSTFWGLTRVAGAMTIRRDERQRALTVALAREGVTAVQEAIARHAGRMEQAVSAHGDGLATSVFTAERWMTNGWRAEKLSRMDAAEAAAARGPRGDSGSFRVVHRAQ
jgi:hypothetical protein